MFRNRLFILSIVLVTIFTLSLGLFVNAEPIKEQKRDKDHKEQFDKDRTRQQDRDCLILVDKPIRDRLRDCDCLKECCCDNLCDRDQLRLRIHNEEVVEEILLLQSLMVKLEDAIEDDDADTIEELLPNIEKVRLQLKEMVKAMNNELEEMKLQLKQVIHNRFANGEIKRLEKRICLIEDAIELIESLIK